MIAAPLLGMALTVGWAMACGAVSLVETGLKVDALLLYKVVVVGFGSGVAAVVGYEAPKPLGLLSAGPDNHPADLAGTSAACGATNKRYPTHKYYSRSKCGCPKCGLHPRNPQIHPPLQRLMCRLPITTWGFRLGEEEVDSLLALFNSLPTAVQGIVLGIVIVVLLKLAIDEAIPLRKRLQNDDNLVLVAFNAIINAAIANAYKAAQDELAKLTNDPDAQRAEVKSIAKALCATLPDILTLHVGDRDVPIPLKMIVSEQIFVDTALASYYKLNDVLANLQKELADSYQQRQQQGAPMPNNPASIGGMVVQVHKEPPTTSPDCRISMGEGYRAYLDVNRLAGRGVAWPEGIGPGSHVAT